MDPALEVVKKLQGRHPEVDCRVFIGGKPGIQNPMVFNMSPGYDAAKYDIVWISTSRIQGLNNCILDVSDIVYCLALSSLKYYKVLTSTFIEWNSRYGCSTYR